MARRFRLETVRKLRRMLEEARMKEFASFERLHFREKGKLSEMKSDLQRAREGLAERTREGVRGQEAQAYLAFMAGQSARIRYQQRILDRVRKEVEVRRKGMREAINKRKAMDNLKERHEWNEAREARRMEALHLDEVASGRHYARKNGRIFGA